MSAPEKARPPEDVGFETGPYVLRSLIHDVALSAGAHDGNDVRITCVEVWQENLYIGTSAGEILHHVQIPPDPSDPSSSAVFILASRLQPPVNQHSNQGIQQILLLPAVNKACILSNNTLNFYTLPELSPAFPQLKPLTCGWVGGVDLDSSPSESKDAVSIMMCLRSKIRLVNIGEAAAKERDIEEFGGCLATVRRGNIACVADARGYTLVNLVAQQKIALPPISSLDSQAQESGGTTQDEPWHVPGGVSRSASSAGNSGGVPASSRLSVQDRGHNRSTSLGIFRTESPGLGDSPRNSMSSRHGFDVPASLSRQMSPRPPISPERRGSEGAKGTTDLSKPLPAPPAESRSGSPAPGPKSLSPLKPMIASPNDSEFLLVTGTTNTEPGLGIFVNLDGEIVRGTIEFSRFPEGMVVDGKGIDLSTSVTQDEGFEGNEEGYVLAVVERDDGNKVIEIQRWDIDPGEGAAQKDWLSVPSSQQLEGAKSLTLGIRKVVESIEFDLPDVVNRLAQKAIRLVDAGTSRLDQEKVSKREREEQIYYQRMSKTKTAITVWTGDSIYWALRNPLVLRLDAQLRLAERASSPPNAPISPQRSFIERLIVDLRDHRSTTELEFYTLAYIRQKAALLLFIDLVLQTDRGTLAFEHDKRATEEALVESEIDPRFVLQFLPGIRDEIVQANEGVWVQGGIKQLVEQIIEQITLSRNTTKVDHQGVFGDNLLQVVKRFLLIWRRKRGNPSVIDGEHVFPTVDAALLRILLILDQQSPKGPATAGSIRAELNSVVDSGVDCFDRAVELLEQHKRLYVLSRLYQSKKNAAQVLATWKRIISGEEDTGGEFTDGEHELRTYLTKLRNRQLVEDYGTWLATRNPKLGVQVFADDNSRTTWTPSDALKILREKAPAAVKEYLEYLVFAKKQSQHINELIAYYLDAVVAELESVPESQNMLKATYETYRALVPPKPTYRQFIEDNAPTQEWWHSRLRLLQLLGGAQGGAGDYDVDLVLERLQPYETALVPEMIILNGRQGHHEQAIRLLTHGLGDFDMAISYCLRGGYTTTASFKDAAFEKQAKLFKILLTEFLRIEDVTDRIERTGELLERFGGWFEIEYVLSVLPDEWSVEIFSGYIVSALGRLVRERNESRIVRALTGSENLRLNVAKIERIEELGSVVEEVV
ncbi:uncharacterized protein PV09_04134 [Verruconis gallopava]|uniref:CNH domain-containing protein n=1 Tax=Verruconis gallopava TaxID=253628 RepID=A0A0D1YWC6_9PEZI|nr:uncharacterized protein PV09_04134 [Verruconis gallopava]KIW04972.1 hypothetical protein PV09_04134 [Verruconis gallopava]